MHRNPLSTQFQHPQVIKKLKFEDKSPLIQKSYCQDIVQQKIYAYLKAKGLALTGQPARGYCHGLALLWALKMSERQEDWFYNLITKICDFDPAELKTMNAKVPKDIFISDFEKFINHIDWAHRPENYINKFSQTDVDKILDLPSRNYDLKNFNQYASMQEHLRKVLSVSSFSIVSGQSLCNGAHSIACYLRDGNYYVFDGRYHSGRAKVFHSIEAAAMEIHNRMLDGFRVHRIPLRMYEFFYSPHLKTQDLPAKKEEHKSVIPSGPQLVSSQATTPADKTVSSFPEEKKVEHKAEQSPPSVKFKSPATQAASNPYAKFSQDKEKGQHSSYGVYRRSYGRMGG